MSHDGTGGTRVLVCIDPDERESVAYLVDAAIDVVEGTGATVYLLYLFSPGEFEESVAGMDVDPTSGTVTPDELARRQESVQEPVERLRRADLDYEIRGVDGGDPAEQAVRHAETLDATVAVVGGRRRSPTGKALFGDYAQRVLLNADCPVLYVKRP